jgi:sugar lactone lactonase YvrE
MPNLLKTLLFPLTLGLATLPALAEPQISVFAGNGETEWNEAGKAATETALINPTGMSLDPQGRILVADMKLHRVLRIDSQNKVEHIAGIGFSGFSGDGGPAAEAFLNGPSAAIADASGNIYIADSLNHRIRKIDTEGIITTLAGTGEGLFGMGSYAGDGGSALAAAFNFPRDIVLEADGSLLVLDQMNTRIRRIAPDGNVTTYIGDNPTDPLALKSPADFHLEEGGRLLIADSANGRIVSTTGSSLLKLVAGVRPSPAIVPEIPTVFPEDPNCVISDATGTLYWGELKLNRLVRCSPGGKTEVLFSGPQANELREKETAEPELGRATNLLLLPDGALLVSDNARHRIWKITDLESE